MRHGVLVLLIAAIGLLVGAGPALVPDLAGPQGPIQPGPVQIVNEPMVIYSVTGGTLTGGVHRQLTVYNNGFATIAKLDTPVFPVPGTFKDVQTANVGSQRALRLLIDLVYAGAATLPDQQIAISDVPLNTLTVLEGKELAYSRTISYWGGFEYARIGRVLDDFVQSTFTGF